MSASLRSVVNRLCIILGLALIAGIRPGVAAADLSSVKAFDIQPQPVASALLKFSSQSGVQVMSSGTELVGKISSRVVGTFAAQAALDHLLKGTGLHYDIIDPNTIAIRLSSRTQYAPAGPTGDQPQNPKRAGRSFSDRLQVARMGQQADTTTDPATSTRQRQSSDEGAALQEIIVTAQKYRQRLFDVPVSMQVVSGATLLRHGITDLNNLQYDVPGLYMDSTGITRNHCRPN
jgi:hypothetical protein